MNLSRRISALVAEQAAGDHEARRTAIKLAAELSTARARIAQLEAQTSGQQDAIAALRRHDHLAEDLAAVRNAREAGPVPVAGGVSEVRRGRAESAEGEADVSEAAIQLPEDPRWLVNDLLKLLADSRDYTQRLAEQYGLPLDDAEAFRLNTRTEEIAKRIGAFNKSLRSVPNQPGDRAAAPRET